MLPSIFLSALWTLVAVLLPLVQSLHALQVGSPERRLWLFYWQCFVAAFWISHWLGWLIRLPFYVLGYIFVDIYEEAQLALVFWLVFPRSLGIRTLQDQLSSRLGKAFGGVASLALGRLTAALPAAPAAHPAAGGAQQESRRLTEPFKDRPGIYTIIKEAGVMSTMGTAKGSVRSKLQIGEVIEVQEVVHNLEERRVRARFDCPEGGAGWISILNMDTGTRWAVDADDTPLPAVSMMPQSSEVFANAAAAGCNPAALFQMPAQGAAAPGEVSDEDAWEAMALLESQLARADDPTEDAPTRQASGMLRQMLGTLAQSPNPMMLSMAQAMVPELGKIWVNESTREYLKDLLAASAGAGVAAVPSAAASATAGDAAASAAGTGSGSGAGSGSGSGGPSAGAGAPSGGSGGGHSGADGFAGSSSSS
mmetsp:Transcript_2225/g.8702  ORF Transcript_2225/g.8702 Transcript_2225/m.8702 type:complete len:422 (-) Transcript_2225:188-1453(-)